MNPEGAEPLEKDATCAGALDQINLYYECEKINYDECCSFRRTIRPSIVSFPFVDMTVRSVAWPLTCNENPNCPREATGLLLPPGTPNLLYTLLVK